MSKKNTIHLIHQVEEFKELLPEDDYLVLCDRNTVNCLDRLSLHIDPSKIVVIEAGEFSKSLQVCELIWDRMIEQNLTRTSTLINIGGGVVTDIGGFCASTYKRGISCIHIPTSLLAMVDASIGGKTGINLRSHKNVVGSFHQPAKTIIYSDFLQTLPEDELRSGYAELVKHGLIASPKLWEITLEQDDLTVIPSITTIERAAQVKIEIVNQDFKENGIRKLLNLGHTIGHALESVSFQKKQGIKHGDAIAAGIICEAYIARHMDLLSNTYFEQIRLFFQKHFPFIHFDQSDIPELVRFCRADKKNNRENINCTLLHEPGKASIDHYPETDLVEQAFAYYLQLANRE